MTRTWGVVHVGVDEARQEQAAPQVDDVLVGVRAGQVSEAATRTNHAALQQDSAVLLGPQRGAGERTVRGVEDGGPVEAH